MVHCRLLHTVSVVFALIGVVPLHVSVYMARMCGGVVALFAGKRFLTSVGEPVRL